MRLVPIVDIKASGKVGHNWSELDRIYMWVCCKRKKERKKGKCSQKLQHYENDWKWNESYGIR